MKQNIKEIYDKFANTYDDAHFSPNSATDYVEKRRLGLIYPYLENVKALRVLDVACGTGTYLAQAQKNGAEVVGCDISENIIRISKNKGLDNVIVNDYHTLPFKNGTFDLILCINAIHYSNNPKKVLSEMRRVLAVNGIILFSYFNILNFRVINYIRKLYLKNRQIAYEHRYFTHQMEKILKEAKLTPTYYCGINLLPFIVNSKPRNKKFLNICHKAEHYINETPMMHFFNEVFVVSKE